MSTERTDKEQKWFRQSQKKPVSLFSSFVSTSQNTVYVDVKTTAFDNATICSDSTDVSGTRRCEIGDA